VAAELPGGEKNIMSAKAKPKPLDVDEMLAKREQKAITVKAPKSFDLYEIEMSNDLVILRGYTGAFGKVRDSTRVYKRVR